MKDLELGNSYDEENVFPGVISSLEENEVCGRAMERYGVNWK